MSRAIQSSYLETQGAFAPQGNVKILIIMENEHRAQPYHYQLSKAGFSCFVSTSGLAALTLLERLKPDVLICTFNVGDMTGLDVHTIIRADANLDDLVFVLLDAKSDSLQSVNDFSVVRAKPEKVLRFLSEIGIGKEDSARFSPPELKGKLDFHRLFNLLAMLSQWGRTGRVTFYFGQARGVIILLKGKPVDAGIQTYRGEQAIYQIFRIARSAVSFSFTFDTMRKLHSQKTIKQSMDELLFQVATEENA